MNFTDFGLSQRILGAIEKQNYVTSTPIQTEAIPYILDNKDLIGIAQTGTGKTAAYSLPILEKLVREDNFDKKIKVLILSPTRELAIQIRDNIRDYGTYTKNKCGVVVGGVNQQSQVNVLKKGIDILVATPGRLLDLIKQRHVNLSNVNMLVIDEADTMLDMGFIKDVEEIIKRTPEKRQTLLFSATMDKNVKTLASKFLTEPVTISVSPETITVSKIKQKLYLVDPSNKLNLLLEILDTSKSNLIFTRTKHGADKLGLLLRKNHIDCGVIHGNKSQNQRLKALDDFKKGKINVLIATDIAARGIDITELSYVINYDMPEHPEIYVHRIGRTARAGLEGTSISLCTPDERKKLNDVERLIKKPLELIDSQYGIVNLDLPKESNRSRKRQKYKRK